MAKTISLEKLALLYKCLLMTTSNQAGEAANAIWKANKILSEHNITWSDLLQKQVGLADSEPLPAGGDVQTATDAKIQRALDALRGIDMGNFSNFIESLDAQWTNRKYLSPAQRKPLFEAYDKYMRR